MTLLDTDVLTASRVIGQRPQALLPNAARQAAASWGAAMSRTASRLTLLMTTQMRTLQAQWARTLLKWTTSRDEKEHTPVQQPTVCGTAWLA
jgi:hypothetical protein